ncbi:peroxisomal carnitine O-octanoyltransferase-like isoform X2 [Hermetia illucens]|uniref:peroxisomal carnitine O-octanoyltransferase-like isoform X2 n=1 Tax=Hermetia illucens TaxID=343691 RepID=UPI0018CC7451|nr:peroxisomal carnitine O-octanoyltransferase-like isoform X2 [Hermetia illucens]
MDYHPNRSKIFLLKENEGKSFDHDPNLPPLPLPKLEETLECYFESLKPFAIPAELAISRKIVDEFKNGFGKTLQEIVEERSWSKKNWINDWWEKYRYHILRFPLYPYVVMGLPLPLQSVGVPENEDYSLKAAARCLYHKIEFWDLLRRERIRPVAPPDGMKYFSMEIFKRLFCTSRIPGEPFDRLDKHFKTVSEGECPTHGIIIAKGRIFQFNCVRLDGNLITPQEILSILHYIRGVIDTSVSSDNIPILTCDDRSSWAKNRKYLEELSRHNAQLLKIIESSVVMACLDNHSPKDYSESSQLALTGDFHSKWADRSNIMVIFRNGKISLIGEPSAYDGRCSISFAFFLLLGLLEMGEPDWYQVPTPILLSPVEHIFNLDERLRKEIVRVLNDCEARRDEITVSYKSFDNYGRKFIADNGMHWDSYTQMAIQLTYYKMHRTLQHRKPFS